MNGLINLSANQVLSSETSTTILLAHGYVITLREPGTLIMVG